MQVHLRSGVERTLEIGLLAGLERRDRPLEQLHVQVVAHLLDLSALLVAEQLAGAADLEVVGREREARAELFERLQRLEAV